MSLEHDRTVQIATTTPTRATAARAGEAKAIRNGSSKQAHRAKLEMGTKTGLLTTNAGSHGALQKRIAHALCAQLDEDGSSSESLSRTAIQASIAWLLCEIPLADAVLLARDAEQERLSQHRSSEQILGWSSQVLALLRQRLPEVYHRLLEYRKTTAIGPP